MSNKEKAEIFFEKYEKKNVDFEDEHYCFKYGSWISDAYIEGLLQGLKESKRLNKLKKVRC